MIRLLAILLLSASALSGCGIKGDLDRPPPLWGERTDDDVPEETSTAEAIENADEPLSEPDPFADPLADDDEPGYGIDVAD